MSLVIESTIEYLKIRLGIPDAKMRIYANKSVEEILKAEAAQGNQAAIQLAADMFTNPTILIELFRLADPKNKLVILNSMASAQLAELLPMLETDDLVEGLKFFSTDGLMNMLQNIPKEELVKTVFQMFSEREIIELMPENQLDKVLTGTDMDKGLLLKNLKMIPEMYLQQVLESVTGELAQGGAADLVNQIGNLGDLAYKQAIKNLQPDQKRQLTLLITSTDNKYYLNFDADAYTKIINREREKPDIVKAMAVIKPEYLYKMLENLPNDILSVVITQIDTEKFAHSLINKYPEVLAKFVAA